MSMYNSRSNTCCFFGHRQITFSNQLIENLRNTIEQLIVKENFQLFLFGSKSEFDDLCWEIVAGLKIKYPHISRVYVRAEYPYINNEYKRYLLERYEYTYFPDRAIDAGRAVYVRRNFEMIDKSSVCIVYYNKEYIPPKRKNSRSGLIEHQSKSGTKIAYDYAVEKNKRIINVAST